MNAAQTTAKANYVAFETMEVGQVRSFGAYEVSEQEIIEFAEKYDPQPFHLDHEAGEASLFGGLCASGWHTCAMTMSLLVADLKERGSSLGSPGLERLSWLKPVYPGDVLSVRLEVLQTKLSTSRPDVGFVTAKTTVLNQHGEEVMEFISTGMFPRAGRRDHGAES